MPICSCACLAPPSALNAVGPGLKLVTRPFVHVPTAQEARLERARGQELQRQDLQRCARVLEHHSSVDRSVVEVFVCFLHMQRTYATASTSFEKCRHYDVRRGCEAVQRFADGAEDRAEQRQCQQAVLAAQEQEARLQVVTFLRAARAADSEKHAVKVHWWASCCVLHHEALRSTPATPAAGRAGPPAGGGAASRGCGSGGGSAAPRARTAAGRTGGAALAGVCSARFVPFYATSTMSCAVLYVTA